MLTKRTVVLGSLTALSLNLHAIEPAVVPLGAFDLYPSLIIAMGHDDNIQSTNSNEISSKITRINPNLLIEAETDIMLLQINYGFEKGIISSSSSDNYLDHDLTASAQIIGNSRNRINLIASIRKGHEVIGQQAGGAQTVTNSPIKFNLNTLDATYIFGGAEAKGQIELRSRLQNKKFTNYRSTTSERDYDQLDLSASFKYRITDKTRAVATVVNSKIDYDDLNKDSTKTKYLIGATWDATAKTSGSINVGWSNKNFKDSNLEDDSGRTWDAAITWAPKTYSVFELSTGQDFSESTTTDSHIDSRNYILSWNHFWKDSIKSIISYEKSNQDFSNSQRSDKSKTITIGMNYEPKRWLNLGLGYTLTDTDSNLETANFKKNTILFTVQGSL
jgi:hypothetical protein